MSAVDDHYHGSSHVSMLTQPCPLTIESLQDELDQLHDQLDQVKQENQIWKARSQEFDTIYEENEYLYEEQTRWSEQLERARAHHLSLEQQIRTLKERDTLNSNETSPTSDRRPPPSSSKGTRDALKQMNEQLQVEIVCLREQLKAMTDRHEQVQRELAEAREQHKTALAVAAVHAADVVPQVDRWFVGVWSLLVTRIVSCHE
jgi:chromosome segregation ATPase